MKAVGRPFSQAQMSWFGNLPGSMEPSSASTSVYLVSCVELAQSMEAAVAERVLPGPPGLDPEIHKVGSGVVSLPVPVCSIGCPLCASHCCVWAQTP